MSNETEQSLSERPIPPHAWTSGSSEYIPIKLPSMVMFEIVDDSGEGREIWIDASTFHDAPYKYNDMGGQVGS